MWTHSSLSLCQERDSITYCIVHGGSPEARAVCDGRQLLSALPRCRAVRETHARGSSSTRPGFPPRICFSCHPPGSADGSSVLPHSGTGTQSCWLLLYMVQMPPVPTSRAATSRVWPPDGSAAPAVAPCELLSAHQPGDGAPEAPNSCRVCHGPRKSSPGPQPPAPSTCPPTLLTLCMWPHSPLGTN